MSSLYRKYRPQIFKDVEGHEHIVKTLQSAIMHDAINHAYLFCGTRGSGKTTLARIFAKSVNCLELKKDKIEHIEPCLKCANCINDSIDIIEIDAASHRGIDEIRDIQESARVSTFGSRYKVFIIDETHMLSPQACNALLKVLEEPPAHVIFVLATTESHKILPTILSRVQRFDFRPLSSDDISSKLNKIAKSEKIKIDDASVKLIAKAGRGSLRDAESILERFITLSNGDIDAKLVSSELGIITPDNLDEFIGHIIKCDKQNALSWLNHHSQIGTKFDQISSQLVEHLRDNHIVNSATTIPQRHAVYLVKLFSKAQLEQPSAIIASLPLELAVLEAISAFSQTKKPA